MPGQPQMARAQDGVTHPTIEEFAPAKINLSLHVVGQRADGYHLLESLVVFTTVGDRLWIELDRPMALDVTGPFAEGVPTDDRNLVWRAAQALGVNARMRLEKNLPHGAGIGGGSSDAAAVLRGLGATAIPPKERLALAGTLGADVPVCMSAKPQCMRGIGDLLAPAAAIPPLDIVLVNPGAHLATPAVFAALDQKENPGMQDLTAWADHASFLAWLGDQRNDLQSAAFTLDPRIKTVLDALDGALLTRMSGSGATCFGLFASAQDARTAARDIASRHPDWWVVATQTIGSQPA